MGAIFLSSAPFVSYAYSPYVYTGNATDITASSATLNGSFNTDSAPTSVWFEYGTNPSLTNPLSVSAYRSGSKYDGSLFVTVLKLFPNTTYYFRAVAQNADGRTYGNVYSFTTNSLYPYNSVNYVYVNNSNISSPPFYIVTEPASFIGNTSVELNALIHNKANNPSNAWFEWGTTISLGNRTITTSVGAFSSVRHVNIMTGLLPGTTYYFRASAENYSSRVNGSILSFTTSGTRQDTKTSATTNIDTTTKTDASTTEEKTDSTQSSLGANTIGSSSFFPINIIGWLILIILVLVLMLLGKYLYGGFSNRKLEHTQEHI